MTSPAVGPPVSPTTTVAPLMTWTPSTNRALCVACTAPAPGFDLDLGAGVGEFHQPGRPVEHDALEGGEEAEW